MVRRRRPSVDSEDQRLLRFDPVEWPGSAADALELWLSSSRDHWQSRPYPFRFVMGRRDGRTAWRPMVVQEMLARVRAARSTVAGESFDEAAYLLRLAKHAGYDEVRPR
ncbi:hypothetical protein [Agrococcus beijingensis]|uniref:hypothetical protein n=1 Tax=Agrococcus beijingensis TaxID=3068634 RepID=UPI0027416782|nr:hypothetical protein [Agrococcus sp. REN33]